jgi:hypothetical protein
MSVPSREARYANIPAAAVGSHLGFVEYSWELGLFVRGVQGYWHELHPQQQGQRLLAA